MTLKYIGNAFLRGVPARDLTDAEVEKHGGEEFLIGTGLYEPETRLTLTFEHDSIATAKRVPRVNVDFENEREQQAPAAPIEQPKRQTKKADWKQLVKDG